MKIDTEGVHAVVPLREQLAEKAHADWSRWTAHMLSVLEPLLVDGTPGEVRHPTRGIEAAQSAVRRWRGQIDTPYHDLTSAEQASHRKLGDATAKLLAEWLENELRHLEIKHAEEAKGDTPEGSIGAIGTLYLREGQRRGYREAYAALAKFLREIDNG